MSDSNIILDSLKIEQKDSHTYSANIGQEQRFGECNLLPFLRPNVPILTAHKSSMAASQTPS